MRRAPRVAVAATLLLLSISCLSGCALAGVATGTYKSQLVAAADAKVKSELADAAIAAASYAVQNNGSYSGANVSALRSSGLVATEVPANFTITVADSGDSYCMQGSTRFGHTIHITSSGTFFTGACPSN